MTVCGKIQSLKALLSFLSAGYDLSRHYSSCLRQSLDSHGYKHRGCRRNLCSNCSGSGLTWKRPIDVGEGAIDADYRGPVGAILFNHSDVDFEVKIGDRIAQLSIQKITNQEVSEVDDLDPTVRGSGGFGSTGF